MNHLKLSLEHQRIGFGSTSIQHVLVEVFFIMEDVDIASHAYDNKHNVSANIDQLLDSREQAANTLFKRFTDLFKGNAESTI